MTELNRIKKEINQIKLRNSRVEADKAWETSWARKALLIAFTYIAIGAYMQAISIEKPWVNAVIPSIGFLLSTLSLPYFRRAWGQHIYKKK